jgi:uncharacterized protein
MMIIVWSLVAIVILYLAMALLVGRVLIYNDVFARRAPDSAPLARHAVENVEFTSPDHLTLRGWFVNSPTNPNGRTAIIVHGWQRNRSRVVGHIELLVDAGFHVLAYDQRGHGASDTGVISYGSGEARDLVAAVEYLKTRPDVDPGRLAAFGFSVGSGCIIYAIANAQEPIFRAVVLEGVFSESYDAGREMLARRFGPKVGYFIGVAFFTVGTLLWTFGRFRHSRPIDLAHKLGSTPLMIIRGKNDHMVPEKSAVAFITRVPEPKVVWINEGGRHSDSYGVYPEEYKSRVIGFLDRQLA